MYPNEARLRNMTYGFTIHYDLDVKYTVGEVKHVSSILDVNSIRTRVVNREREKADGVKLESAKIVIGETYY